MKKSHICVIILMIISLSVLLYGTAHAQDTSKITVSTVYHDVKNGIDTNAPKIEKAIGTIAKDLKVGADQVWNILVKQQKVWSFCFLLLTLSALTNWYFFYKNNLSNRNLEKVPLKTTFVKDKGYSYEKHEIQESEQYILKINNNYKWFKYLHLATCLILSVFSYLHFADMLTGFMNPEFGAMKTIAEVAQHIK